MNFLKNEEFDSNLNLKDLTFFSYMQNGRLTDLESLLYIIEILTKNKLYSELSRDKFLNNDLNSSNIKLTKYLDIIIEYVYTNPKLEKYYKRSELLSSRIF